MRLLLVEDEADLAEIVARGLREAAYAVDVCCDGGQAAVAFEVNDYDIVVLDLGLPDIDGLSLLRQMRRIRPSAPILVLTARRRAEERVEGLDAGADDYLCKPFFFKELLARTRALVRRDLRVREPALVFGDVKLDSVARLAWIGDRQLELTRKELALLDYFMRHVGEVISQEALLEHVWDSAANPFTNTVRVHINSLRQKLGDEVSNSRYIHTVVGEGYRFAPSDE